MKNDEDDSSESNDSKSNRQISRSRSRERKSSSSSSRSSSSSNHKYKNKRKRKNSKSPSSTKSKSDICYITSFGTDNNNLNNNETNTPAEDAILSHHLNKLKKTTSLNLHLLKQDRSSLSRSRSKSPLNVSFKKSINDKKINTNNDDNKVNNDKTSSEEDTSSEDEEYKNYLKRRANRLQNDSFDNKLKLVKTEDNISFKTIGTCSLSTTSTSNTGIILNKGNGNASSKVSKNFF
jgi:hypothetical protein